MFSIFLSPCSAQSSIFSSKGIKSYQAIISGDLEYITSPILPEEHYLYVYQITLKLLLTEQVDEEAYDYAFQNALDSYSDQNTTQVINYFESETRLLASLAFLKYERQIDAAWQLRQSNKIARRNHEEYPEFIPSLKTLGLLEVLIGSVPEKYQWLLSLAGLHGSVPNGLADLHYVIRNSNLLSTETKLLNAITQVYILGNNDNPHDYLYMLENDNVITRLVKAAIWSKSNYGNKIIQLTESLRDNEFPHMYYLIAEAYIQAGEYRNALSFFNLFLENYQGISNRKDAFFKMYLCYLYENNKDANQYRMLALNQETKSAADRNAEELLKAPINLDIMKLRLATDGGFYDTAQKLLKDVTLNNMKDSVEFVYRIARLNHKTNHIEKAILNYQKTLSLTGKEHWYFAPNSALQLGLIFENMDSLDSAKLYYQKALNFKHHLYKNSIDTKCEAGINRIEAQLND